MSDQMWPLKKGAFIYGSAQLQSALSELNDKSPRTIAVVGAAIVEEELSTYILQKLRRAKHAERNLFGRSRPLGMFTAKIDIGLLLGLYTQRVHRELSTISEIRNRFSHSIEISSFDVQAIADKCKTLTLYKERGIILRGHEELEKHEDDTSKWQFTFIIYDLDDRPEFQEDDV